MSSKAKKSSKEKEIIFPRASDLDYYYGFVLKIYPNCEQKRIIQHNINACNAVYNRLVKAGRCRLPKTHGNFPVFQQINQRISDYSKSPCKKMCHKVKQIKQSRWFRDREEYNERIY